MSEEDRDQGLSQDLQTRQAREMAQRLFTDMMADAGVDMRRMSQEVLWFLPRDFVDAYSEVFYRAFAGKDDGGTGGRGAMDEEKRIVGKASGKGLQGLGGAKRKTYKKYWVIADDKAVRIKDLVDRRLRAMARELKLELAARDDTEAEERLKCEGCKRYVQAGWQYCPGCGAGLRG